MGKTADGNFATAEETAYPYPLCDAIAAAVMEKIAFTPCESLDEFEADVSEIGGADNDKTAAETGAGETGGVEAKEVTSAKVVEGIPCVAAPVGM